MELKFEWDENKNLKNIKKHDIAFQDVLKVFYDPKRQEVYDIKHSFFEDRWEVIGLSDSIIYKVNYTERDEFIRIISARNATKKEEKRYFYGNGKKNN